QQAHESEMTSGSGMMDEPNAVDVPAGGTVQLVYTFDQPGTLEYGCHVPGHYGAGMRGTITIS
ncbi:MAG: multicopper oxidase domain-containing protein, partial [Mycobacterium sp.]|nr:multicopper oxidase domain-containing protein [Mycobacterium sp.]